MKECVIVYTTIHEVHFTSVYIRFKTIAIQPIQFKYEVYMVKNGQTRVYTVSMSIRLFMVSNSLILLPVASAIVLYNYNIGFSSLKIYEAKP